MATLLHRLGKTAFRHWALFLSGWIVTMIVLGSVAATLSKPMSVRLVLDPRHRVGEGSGPAVRALPRSHRRLRPGLGQGRGRRTRGRDPGGEQAGFDALVADLAALPQMPDGKDGTNPAPANPVPAAAARRLS